MRGYSLTSWSAGLFNISTALDVTKIEAEDTCSLNRAKHKKEI
jgi:hypothetical protein